ncbi:MAG: hypothetical protein ACOZQL_36615 [Myxococcota bacterium]
MRVGLLLVLVLAGCVTPVSFDQARQRVLLRASFEFGCPPDKLQVQELSSDEAGPVYLGVTGCSRRAVYVRLNTGAGALFLNDTVPGASDTMPPSTP